jgi:hypothetical protein
MMTRQADVHNCHPTYCCSRQMDGHLPASSWTVSMHCLYVAKKDVFNQAHNDAVAPDVRRRDSATGTPTSHNSLVTRHSIQWPCTHAACQARGRAWRWMVMPCPFAAGLVPALPALLLLHGLILFLLAVLEELLDPRGQGHVVGQALKCERSKKRP